MDHSVAFSVCPQIRVLGRPTRGHVSGKVAQTPSPRAGRSAPGATMALSRGEAFPMKLAPHCPFCSRQWKPEGPGPKSEHGASMPSHQASRVRST